MMDAFAELHLSESPKFLVDTYCGSGLFSVTCSKGFQSVIGVDVSEGSIKCARENAKANDVANAKFIYGNAEKIFEFVKSPADLTAVVIDPPRKVCYLSKGNMLTEKGCDDQFLDQLLELSPRVIVYVSCNVHSQARDIAQLLNDGKAKYKVVSIRPFDLFPQTFHMESIVTVVRYEESTN
jgi:tRNA (uracil-5-)-methyltransferase